MKITANTLDLIRKYNQPGPRYTSYPTALRFVPDFDREAALAQTRASRAPLSLYFHLPFCESLCWFCGCTTVITRDRRLAGAYLDSLEREMDLAAALLSPGRQVVQMHFGGGTPSFLTPDQIVRLGLAIRQRFQFRPEAEIGVELEPRGLTRPHVEAFRAMGCNRASMGVQDCDPLVQKAIHRVQPSHLNQQAVDWLRELGFVSINLDLIYGLPLQTVDSFDRTLEETLAYNPDRYAVFSYAHVPWMKPAQKILERKALPPPETKLNLLRLVIEKLTSRGYVYIGMDHFAKADDELAIAQNNGQLQRNFQGYSTWGGSEILAFGMSAISQSSAAYRQNHKDLLLYSQALAAGQLPIERGCLLSAEDLRRREIILRLMCDLQLDFDALSERFNFDFSERYSAQIASLDDLEADGLLIRHPGGLRVTETGRLLIRNIAMRFDAYHLPGSNRHAKTI